MTSPVAVRFGQVWESPDEAIGSMRYLVVSSDAYNDAFGDRKGHRCRDRLSGSL